MKMAFAKYLIAIKWNKIIALSVSQAILFQRMDPVSEKILSAKNMDVMVVINALKAID